MTTDITLAQLTTATVNTGKVVGKLYRENAEQFKKLDRVEELVEDLATKRQDIDVTPLIESLDAMRNEQVEAIEGVANIVKPLIGAQATVKETVTNELATVRNNINNIQATVGGYNEVLQTLVHVMNRIGDSVKEISDNQQRLNDKLDAMERRVSNMDESLVEATLQMTETRESNIETAARVKTLGVQVSSMMLSSTASEDDLISLMVESSELLEGDQ